MNEKIKNAINKGDEIAKEHNPTTLVPFPFDKILEKEKNLKIEVSSFLSSVDDKISGVLLAIKDGDKINYTILVNNSKHKNRIYFTIAHELGHYFLHKDELEKGMIVDDEETQRLFCIDGSLSDDKEKEANYFAATLLMPEDAVKKTWEKLKDVDQCASIFSVSVDAMSIRLGNLDLID